MSYKKVINIENENADHREYQCQTIADISTLPNMTSEGEKCGVGSKTYVEEDGSEYRLSINNTWLEQPSLKKVKVDVNSNAGKSSVSVARPDDTTPYSINDVVGGNMTFVNVLPTAGQQFIITGVTLKINVAAIPVGMGSFKLYLYDASPAAIADNAAYNLPAADRVKCLGVISIAAPADIGDTLLSQNDNVNFNGKLAAGSTSLYGLLVTDNVYTPSALTVKAVTIYTLGV